MSKEQERAQDLYDKIQPEAKQAYIDAIVSKTPPELQAEMRAIAEADMSGMVPPEPDPTQATITNGQSVTVNDNTGAPAPGSPGTAVVANGTLTAVVVGLTEGTDNPTRRR